MKTHIIALTTLLTGTACLSAETHAEQQPVQADQPLVAAAATTSTDELCRPFMQRQRACSTTFIPALVEARVEHDNPRGVSAREKELGREALLEEAFDEWATDSTDQAIDALCDDIAQSTSLDKDVQLRTSISSCLAQSGCDAFVGCAVPLSLNRWKE